MLYSKAASTCRHRHINKDLDTVTLYSEKMGYPKACLGHITAKSMQTPPVATYFSALFPMFPIYFQCSQSTEQRLEGTSPSLAGCPGGVRGKRDLRCCFYHPPWQLVGWRLGWKDCCSGWLLLDLLAISRTALLPRRLGCYVTDCA